ncbi:MAG: hypothetical protein WAW11_02495 [Patescibacteria group bacterium]
MSKILITPILLQYDFLDKLCNEAASLLSLDLNNQEKHRQFKISIFLNFNRYLMESLLFLPNDDAEKLLGLLTPAMETANEAETINILNNNLDFFPEVRSEFLDIIKNIKK